MRERGRMASRTSSSSSSAAVAAAPMPAVATSVPKKLKMRPKPTASSSSSSAAVQASSRKRETSSSSSSSAAAAAAATPVEGDSKSVKKSGAEKKVSSGSDGAAAAAPAAAAPAKAKKARMIKEEGTKKKAKISSSSAAAAPAKPKAVAKAKSARSTATTSKKKKSGEKVVHEFSLCGICFEEKYDFAGAIECCKHSYCYDCIYKWSSSCNTCPQCKRRFNKISKINVSTGKKAKATSVKNKDFGGNLSGGVRGIGGFSLAPVFGLNGQNGQSQMAPALFQLMIGPDEYSMNSFFHTILHQSLLNELDSDEEDDEDYLDEFGESEDEEEDEDDEETFQLCPCCNELTSDSCMYCGFTIDGSEIDEGAEGSRTNPITLDSSDSEE